VQNDVSTYELGAQQATLYETCWIMALSVIEANSTDPEEVSATFRDVASNYDGSYELDEVGDRCNYKYGLAKISLDKTTYIHELCGLYDVSTGKLKTYSNFP